MSGGTTAHLVMMANQIARNLAHERDPAGATAEHIRAFWTGAMIAQARGAADCLDPVARAALEALG